MGFVIPFFLTFLDRPAAVPKAYLSFDLPPLMGGKRSFLAGGDFFSSFPAINIAG